MTGLASKSQLRMSFLRYALFTVPAVVLLGTISGQLAGSGDGNSWFDALVKPDFMPPGWVFGAAWTFLYVLLGLAFAMLLHARGALRRDRVIALFVLQLAVNYAWSPAFFALHRTELALAMIGAMIVLTVTLIALAWPIRKAAALLLLPYLGWLCFAGALNWQIVALNPNAGQVAPGQAGTDIPL